MTRQVIGLFTATALIVASIDGLFAQQRRTGSRGSVSAASSSGRTTTTRQGNTTTTQGQRATGTRTVEKAGDGYNVNREVSTDSGASKSVSKDVNVEDKEVDRSSTTTGQSGQSVTRERQVEGQGGYATIEGSAKTSTGREASADPTSRSRSEGRHLDDWRVPRLAEPVVGGHITRGNHGLHSPAPTRRPQRLLQRDWRRRPLQQCLGNKSRIPPRHSTLCEAVRLVMDKPFTEDFDAMVKRRAIRVAVTFNRTHYFIDKGQERGLSYEALKAFETDLNTDAKTGNLKVHVVIVPMSRDQLYPALASGKVDMVAAMVTVRPELEALAAFSEPTRTNVSQVVVTGPGAPPIATLDDLAGHEVFVRKASAYYESLTRLNEQLKARGKPAIVIDEAPDVLEDDDVLEMVNAGLAPITVVDDYLAGFWSQIFTGITVHQDLTVRSGGNLAVAFRKNNPRLREAVNDWLRRHGKGDAFRNVIERRYLKNVSYAKNAATEAERQKFQVVVDLFKKYGAQYDVDYLLMAAQGYQESTLDQNVKSPVGAIGIMQVMPPTGKELKVGDITQVDANVHAGVKYMRFMMDQYFADEPMDPLNRALMTFAAYNAGPGRLRQLRREAKQRELDPNVWFGNVERVASERIGRETVTYVSNIYKYYITYRLLSAQRDKRVAAKAAVAKQK